MIKLTTRKRYTSEFKAQAVELLESGKPVPQLAVELGLRPDLLYGWRRTPQGPQPGSAGARAVGEGSEADGLRALRREIALLKSENDILKKAAVIPGTRPLPSFGA